MAGIKGCPKNGGLAKATCKLRHTQDVTPSINFLLCILAGEQISSLIPASLAVPGMRDTDGFLSMEGLQFAEILYTGRLHWTSQISFSACTFLALTGLRMWHIRPRVCLSIARSLLQRIPCYVTRAFCLASFRTALNDLARSGQGWN